MGAPDAELDLEEVTPWIRRLALRTPTLPPATSTNTLIVGHAKLLIIEPATPHPNEQERLVAAIEALVSQGATVTAIAITHHHSDHVGFVTALQERFPAPIYAHPETIQRVDFEVDHELLHGHRIELDEGIAVEAEFTPGHAPGHLVFHETRSGVAHAGDMVAGEGTILIDPEDSGDMTAYLSSLHQLLRLGLRAVVPAHGPVIEAPDALFRHYIDHRLAREAKVVAGIGTDPTKVDDVLAVAYADTPRFVWPLAVRSLEAHLRKLEVEGRIARDGETVWMVETSTP